MFHVEHFRLGLPGWSLMFHVEHCNWANSGGFRDTQPWKVYSLPAIGGAWWWFRDHDDSPCLHQFSRPLQGELRWTKPSRASRIKGVFSVGGPSKTLYIGTHHRNLFLNTQSFNGSLQGVGPLRAAIHQRQLNFRPGNGNDQPWNSGSTSQIHTGSNRKRESVSKSTCVGNHVFHGLCAERTNALSRTKDADQPLVFGWMRNCHRGSLVRPLLADRLQGQPQHGGVGLVLANGWQYLQNPQVCREQSCGLQNSLARELVVVHLRAHRLPP